LIAGRRASSAVGVMSLRGTVCDTDKGLVLLNVIERESVTTQKPAFNIRTPYEADMMIL
jgi:hypothetical protein